MSVSATYLFSRGLRLPVFVDTNLAPAHDYQDLDVTDANGVTLQQVTVPFYTSRIDNAAGIILTGFSTLNSWYHGVVFSVRKPFSNGIELLANYTLSKAIDNGQVIGTNGTFNGTDTPWIRGIRSRKTPCRILTSDTASSQPLLGPAI